MGRVLRNSIDFTGSTIIELTKAEYDALPSSKYSDNIIYMIKDVYSANSNEVIGMGDCYSMSEKIVGCWTDGKPLYEKTFDLGSDTDISYNSWTETTISWQTISVERLVGAKGFTSSGGTFAGTLLASKKSNGNVEIQTPRNNYNLGVRYLTLQYTKTTDVAGSGDWTPSGVPAVHYDTDEQIIGTWVDGKTLYQKTIHYTGTINANTTVTLANVTSLNIGTVVLVRGVIKESGWGTVEMPCKEGRLQVSDGSTKNLTLVMGNISFSPADAYITIQYTKAS